MGLSASMMGQYLTAAIISAMVEELQKCGQKMSDSIRDFCQHWFVWFFIAQIALFLFLVNLKLLLSVLRDPMGILILVFAAVLCVLYLLKHQTTSKCTVKLLYPLKKCSCVY